MAELRKNRVGRFVFNRLTLFGEGASPAPVGIEQFEDFLRQYRQTTVDNPILGCKDNLFNRLNSVDKMPLSGGCVGFGCGAGFNFMALLPDGKIHAYRKFPSYIGNIFDQSLHKIYYSERAEKYRQGCLECKGCFIRAVCGGYVRLWLRGTGLICFRTEIPTVTVLFN